MRKDDESIYWLRNENWYLINRGTVSKYEMMHRREQKEGMSCGVGIMHKRIQQKCKCEFIKIVSIV